jgi:hypothetical protein
MGATDYEKALSTASLLELEKQGEAENMILSLGNTGGQSGFPVQHPQS